MASSRFLKLPEGLFATVDADDFERLAEMHWGILRVDRWVYAVHRWRDGIGGPVKLTYLHREVAQAPRGALVRFKSRNTLDCRRANLRIPEPSNRI